MLFIGLRSTVLYTERYGIYYINKFIYRYTVYNIYVYRGPEEKMLVCCADFNNVLYKHAGRDDIQINLIMLLNNFGQKGCQIKSRTIELCQGAAQSAVVSLQ